MAEDQTSHQLSEAEVRARLEAMIPTLRDWNLRLAHPWAPQPGSALAADDLAAPDIAPSAKARMTLAIGTDHLTTAVHYMLGAGPTMYSMSTVLRTAMLGGAQAIYVLQPAAHSERVKRHRRVEGTSVSYLKAALAGIGKTHPESFDEGALQRDQVLANERLSRNPGTVNATQLVREAAKYVFRTPPNAQAEAACMVAWQTGSCTAHALPWEHELRPADTYEHAGSRTTVLRATLTSVQDSLSFAFSFLDVGWSLLDARSQAGS